VGLISTCLMLQAEDDSSDGGHPVRTPWPPRVERPTRPSIRSALARRVRRWFDEDRTTVVLRELPQQQHAHVELIGPAELPLTVCVNFDVSHRLGRGR
jgi:hypothetical protein